MEPEFYDKLLTGLNAQASIHSYVEVFWKPTFQRLVSYHITTGCHHSEDDMNLHSNESLKTLKILLILNASAV
jgi:hypothetical protein